MARMARKCWLCPAGHSMLSTLPMGSAPHPTALEPPTPGSCSQWHQGAPRPHLLVPVLRAGGGMQLHGTLRTQGTRWPIQEGDPLAPPLESPSKGSLWVRAPYGEGERRRRLVCPKFQAQWVRQVLW